MSIARRRFAVSAFAVVLALCCAFAFSLANSHPAHAKVSSTKAHSLYESYLRAQMSDYMSFGEYKFVDITGDGVDEMITGWWPSVCTIKSGKVKVAISVPMGSCSFGKVYKKKHVITLIEPDHMGSSSTVYYKWSKAKKKFVRKASTYSPTSDAKRNGAVARHTVKGKKVSKAKFKAYKKKLLGTSKGTRIKFSTL